MPMNRDRLADALAGATPDQLRADAAMLYEVHCGAGVQDSVFRGMALLLAVADVSTTSDARIEQAGRADYLILDIPMPETHTMGYGACELIPALASLLRGGA